LDAESPALFPSQRPKHALEIEAEQAYHPYRRANSRRAPLAG